MNVKDIDLLGCVGLAGEVEALKLQAVPMGTLSCPNGSLLQLVERKRQMKAVLTVQGIGI